MLLIIIKLNSLSIIISSKIENIFDILVKVCIEIYSNLINIIFF